MVTGLCSYSIFAMACHAYHARELFLLHASKSKPEDHWSCIAHLSAQDMLKSGVIEEKKFKNIESE